MGFIGWITSKETLSEVAKKHGVSVQTLCAWFGIFWRRPPRPVVPRGVRLLVLDATSVTARALTLLIAGDAGSSRPVSWMPAERECHASWAAFLLGLAAAGVSPEIVVCDGQRGLLKALREVWPLAKVQRCLIHVVRQASAWLTRNPKTAAGAELLAIVGTLPRVADGGGRSRFVSAFGSWCARHEAFLNERTFGPNGRWWRTHRKLRGTRALIRNAVPDLFRFIDDPTAPRTSNHVEGGMNARLKELFRCHRGLQPTKKLALASWYLSLRQGRKTNTKL